MADERLARHEVTILRRSLACTGQLPVDRVHRVLDELEAVLAERDELMRIVDQLAAGPWPEVRQLLAELHRRLHEPP